MVDQINSVANTTGVSATLSGQTIQLEGNASGIVFGDEVGGGGGTIAAIFNGTNNVALNEIAGNGAVSSATLAAGGSVDGGIKLSSENGTPISINLGENATAADIGLNEQNTTANGKFGSAVNSIDISTAAGAQKAIGIIDNALEQINETRGELGAVNNRLDFTVSNLSNVAENASAARSQILDADFAAESANLSRAQVLQQAGSAMLAQANAAPQQVLSLLQ